MAGIDSTVSYGRMKNRMGRREAGEVLTLLEELDAGTMATTSVSATGSISAGTTLAAGTSLTVGTTLLVGTTSTFTDDVTFVAEWRMNDGDTHHATVDCAALAADRTYTIPDAGGAAEFVMTGGAQSLSGTKTFESIISNNTIFNAGTNILGATTVNAAKAASSFTGKITGVVDNTATAILSMSVPNADHAAAVKLTLLGTVANFHSSRVAEGLVVISRDAGDDTVAVVATLELAQIATGGTETLTLAYDLSSIAGASSATQTFDIRVTLNTSASTAAQIVYIATLLNAEASGITMGTP